MKEKRNDFRQYRDEFSPFEQASILMRIKLGEIDAREFREQHHLQKNYITRWTQDVQTRRMFKEMSRSLKAKFEELALKQAEVVEKRVAQERNNGTWSTREEIGLLQFYTAQAKEHSTPEDGDIGSKEINFERVLSDIMKTHEKKVKKGLAKPISLDKKSNQESTIIDIEVERTH